MTEKNEKWFVFALIALAIYYFIKKAKPASAGQTASSAGAGFDNLPLASGAYYNPASGSVVNPTDEANTVIPFQTSRPVIFSPAQPSSVPISQMVRAGVYNFGYPDTRSPLRSQLA